MRDEATPYDQVRYPGEPFAQTHPGHLGAMASWYGMRPALPSRCRVLELGCGIGGNLIPVAYQNPGSTFLGVDLSARQIEHGCAVVSELGLRNIKLEHRDIMNVTRALGEFDFIVAHGVYSWAPDAVRKKMLSIARENLAPQGVAFVSFKAYPGCRRRDIARDLMRFHTRHTSDARKRVQDGRAVMELFGRSVSAGVYGSVLREQDRWVKDTCDEVVYHDDLADVSAPFLLHQVVDAAAEEGLQYLGEATFARSSFGAIPAQFAETLAQFSPERVLAREQYFDFFVGSTFRETLFCHADVALRRTIPPSRVKDFWLATNAFVPPDSPHFSTAELAATEPANGEFPAEPFVAAALQHLRAAWPRSIRFANLAEAGQATSGHVAACSRDEAEDALARALLSALRAGTLHLDLEPPHLSATPSERPCASAVARSQARGSARVTNLRHAATDLTDNRLRRCLMLADCTRSAAQIAQALSESEHAEGGAPVTVAQAEHCLHELAARCLLVA